MKRTVKYLAPIAVLFALAVFVCLYFMQPLISSQAYTASATLDGAPTRVELFHPPFIPGTYYLHLPDAQPQRYRWLGVAFSRQSVFSPVAVHTGWCSLGYIHSDQAKGVRLTDGKIEDHWSVAFTSAGVQFSNGSLSISLTNTP